MGASPVYGLSIFKNSSYGQSASFLLAASETPQAGYGISVASLQNQTISDGEDDFHVRTVLGLNPTHSSDEKAFPVSSPLLFSSAIINGDNQAATSAGFAGNPLYATYFTCLACYPSGSPVVVPANTQSQMYLLEGSFQTPSTDGNQTFNGVMNIVGSLKDGAVAPAPNAVISQVIAPQSSTPGIGGNIFAAVGSGASLGIAGINPVFSVPNKGLIPFDITAGTAGNASYALSADIGINASNQITTFMWDEITQRLYCGFETRLTNGSGVMSVWVVRLDSIPPYARVAGVVPFIPSGLLPNNTVGIGQSVRSENFQINKIAMLHASTGRSYLIVQGGKKIVTDNTYRVGMWAFPIIKTSRNPALVGTASLDEDGTAVATGLPANALLDMAHNIAGTAQFNSADVQISDICVAGDSVFVAVKRVDPTDATKIPQTGIFMTTALFDSGTLQGGVTLSNIRAWSQWKRVAYFGDDVHGVGYDTQTGRLWAVVGTNKNTVQVNDWEMDTVVTQASSDVVYTCGVSAVGATPSSVQSIINKALSADDQGGVSSVASLDLTAFATPAAKLVAFGGNGTVVLVQAVDSDGGPLYDATRMFTVTNLPIGLITSICFVSDGATNVILCGGTQGLVSIAPLGGRFINGIDWKTQLDGGFVIINNFDFSQVRALASKVSIGRSLGLTPKTLYALYSSNGATQGIEASIADMPDALPSDEFLSLLVFGGAFGGPNPRYFLGTTKGLYTKLSTDANWVECKNSANNSLGPVRGLQAFTVPGGAVDGNLYVFVSARSRDMGLVYRFDVFGGNVDLITEPTGRDYLKNIGSARENFLVDGGHVHHALVPLQSTLALQPTMTKDYLKLIQLNYSASGVRSEQPEPVQYNTLPERLTALTRVSGWDSLVLATDWGISIRN